MDKKLKIILILIIIAISFVIIRKPFYAVNLGGEDGLFAELFTNQPDGPKYQPAARIFGKELYGPPRHPALIYETLSFFGKVTETVIDYSRLSQYKTTVLLRAFMSLFQLFVWILIWFCVLQFDQIENKNSLIIFLILLMFSPMAIEGSTKLQVDNTVGPLFVGFFCFSLLIYQFIKSRAPAIYILIFAASVLMGFGKNEWSIAFLISFIATVCFMKIFSLKIENKLIIVISLGFIIGNAINYFYDPYNYMAGIGLMNNMIKDYSELLTISTRSAHRWFARNIARAPYTLPVMVLVLFITSRFFANLKKLSFAQIFLYTFSCALFFSFSISHWNSEYRYFFPAFFASIFAFFILNFEKFNKTQKVNFYLVWALILITNFTYFKDAIPYITPDPINFTAYPSYPDCTPLLSTVDAYFNPEIDYIASSLGLEAAEKRAEANNTEVCLKE